MAATAGFGGGSQSRGQNRAGGLQHKDLRSSDTGGPAKEVHLVSGDLDVAIA